MSLKQAWARVEQIFEQNNPNKLPALERPSTQDELAALEKHLGFPIPQELKESLSIHSGENDAGFTSVIGCEQICREIDIQVGLLPDFEGEDVSHNEKRIKEVFWSEKWIPFAADGSGNLWCVDMDPTEQGSPGQIIFWDHEDQPQYIASSIAEYLNSLADNVGERIWGEYEGKLVCDWLENKETDGSVTYY